VREYSYTRVFGKDLHVQYAAGCDP
jgi:hypothetical protein